MNNLKFVPCCGNCAYVKLISWDGDFLVCSREDEFSVEFDQKCDKHIFQQERKFDICRKGV